MAKKAECKQPRPAAENALPASRNAYRSGGPGRVPNESGLRVPADWTSAGIEASTGPASGPNGALKIPGGDTLAILMFAFGICVLVDAFGGLLNDHVNLNASNVVSAGTLSLTDIESAPFSCHAAGQSAQSPIAWTQITG